MSIGVFSDIGNNVKNNAAISKNSDKSLEKNDKKSLPSKEKLLNGIKTYVPYILPLAAIPVTALITYKISSKNIGTLKTQITDLSQEIENLKELSKTQAEKLTNGLKKQAIKTSRNNSQIWGALIGIAGLGGAYKVSKLSDDDKKEISSKASAKVDDALSRASEALSSSDNSLNRKYTKNHNGIVLLNTSDALNLDTNAYQKAIKAIETAAPDRLYKAPTISPINKPNPTLWSVTSEFAPIKEGGLGSVPVELQNNMTKLGVDVPTFIPMYQQKGIASFRKENGKYFYNYKGKEFELEKAASFKLDTYQDGKSKTENVNIFVTTLGKEANGLEKRLVFVQNDTYFNGTIYQPSEKTEEPEKFAFFSKAVYEFAKAKEDKNSVKGLEISNKDVFDSIKSPDGLILNDWQASPIAALARYKAPMENAYKQLSSDAAKKLSEMRIIAIGHNAMYQGSTRNNNDDMQRYISTSNILNTLFDNYAYDIVSHANTQASKTDFSDLDLRNLDNVLILNHDDPRANHTNLLNMGVCLSDYFHPVSENYAKEIISDDHPDLAHELRWALKQRDNTGSLVGIINGNDFANLNIESKKGAIKKTTGIDVKTYTKNSSLEEIMEARAYNKRVFYNEFMKPFTMKNSDIKSDQVEKIKSITERFEFVDPTGKTTLPDLTDEELSRTPIISSAGRLVSQKGISLMADAIKMLYKNWEKDFPNKPKPIFYIAGQDGEGGVQRAYIEELKKDLPKEDSDRVIFGHGFAPMQGIMASSDFFLLPSIFEPCGLTQGESFALATPVIGSAVGGIVDTVNRDGKTNGVLTDKNKKLDATGFYNAMKKGLEIYFDQPLKYTNMVRNSLDEDFSWIQKGKQGPVYDYLDKIGLKRDTLPDVE